MKIQKHQVGKILEYIPKIPKLPLPTSALGFPGMAAPMIAPVVTEYGPEIIENFKRGVGNVYNTAADLIKSAPFPIPGVQNLPGGTVGRTLQKSNKKAKGKINGKEQIKSPWLNARIFQQGGNMDSSDKKEQEEFAQFLVQKSGAKTQKELEAFVKEQGEEGMKKLYSEFKSKKKQKAKHGAKLDYINYLKFQFGGKSQKIKDDPKNDPNYPKPYSDNPINDMEIRKNINRWKKKKEEYNNRKQQGNERKQKEINDMQKRDPERSLGIYSAQEGKKLIRFEKCGKKIIKKGGKCGCKK